MEDKSPHGWPGLLPVTSGPIPPPVFSQPAGLAKASPAQLAISDHALDSSHNCLPGFSCSSVGGGGPRTGQLSRLHPRGSSDEHRSWCRRRSVGGRVEAALFAARLMAWGWASGVPPFFHHGELERGPSPLSFLFSLLYSLRVPGRGLPLSLMAVTSSTPHLTHPLARDLMNCRLKGGVGEKLLSGCL